MASELSAGPRKVCFRITIVLSEYVRDPKTRPEQDREHDQNNDDQYDTLSPCKIMTEVGDTNHQLFSSLSVGLNTKLNTKMATKINIVTVIRGLELLSERVF